MPGFAPPALGAGEMQDDRLPIEQRLQHRPPARCDLASRQILQVDQPAGTGSGHDFGRARLLRDAGVCGQRTQQQVVADHATQITV